MGVLLTFFNHHGGKASLSAISVSCEPFKELKSDVANPSLYPEVYILALYIDL